MPLYRDLLEIVFASEASLTEARIDLIVDQGSECDVLAVKYDERALDRFQTYDILLI